MSEDNQREAEPGGEKIDGEKEEGEDMDREEKEEIHAGGEEKPEKPEGELKDDYEVRADGVPARVRIVDEEEEYVLTYNVKRPEIRTATEAVLS
ncbi:MAG: hypothetical protein ABEJ66_03395, partial [Candidatus Nanohaloarchaea archaeon]